MDMYLEKMFNFFGSNQEGSWVVYIAVTAGHFMRVWASFQAFATEMCQKRLLFSCSFRQERMKIYQEGKTSNFPA